MKQGEVTNVTVVSSSHAYGVEGIYHGARYHIWVKRKNGTVNDLERDILYKNPLSDVAFKSDGWFDTRRLNALAPSNIPLTTTLLEMAQRDNLYEEADKRVADEAEQQRVTARLNARIRTIKEAGPILLAALERVVVALDAAQAAATPEEAAKIKAEHQFCYDAIAVARKGE